MNLSYEKEKTGFKYEHSETRSQHPVFHNTQE